MSDTEPAFLDGELDSVDNLPEPIRPFFKQHADGKYRPNIRPVNGWAFENVGGLRSTMSKLKESERLLKDLQGRYGDLDADAAREALAKVEELRNAVPEDKVKDKISAKVEEARRQYEADLKRERERAESSDKKFDSYFRRSEVVAGIASQQGNVKQLYDHMYLRSRRVSEDGRDRVLMADENGELLTKIDGSYVTPAEYAATLKDDPDWRSAFPGTAATGSGASNANGQPRHSGSALPRDIPAEQRLEMIRQRGAV